MHFDYRLWGFTRGVRGRIFFAVLIGVLATALGVARLALLGWLIGLVFQGHNVTALFFPLLVTAQLRPT